MPLTDLRLQMDYQTRYPVSPKGSLYPVYRFARANGWSCGHWHWSLDEAEECLDAKLAVIRHRQEAGDAGQSPSDRP